MRRRKAQVNKQLSRGCSQTSGTGREEEGGAQIHYITQAPNADGMGRPTPHQPEWRIEETTWQNPLDLQLKGLCLEVSRAQLMKIGKAAQNACIPRKKRGNQEGEG